MRVLVLSANIERSEQRVLPLGAAIVTAAVRTAGHEATLVDLMGEADPGGAVGLAVKDVGPHVVGVSVRNIDDQSSRSPRFLLEGAFEVVEACRACTRAPIVVGGAGFSIFPESALRYLGADIGIRGEGERAFPRVLEKIDAGDDPGVVPGVVVRGARGTACPERIADLDALPALDPSDLDRAVFEDSDLWWPIQSRRGCSIGCSYCSTPRIEGCRERSRSVPAVVEDVRRAVSLGARRFQLVDNTFNRPREYAVELCEALSGLSERIQWRCIVYPGSMDRGLADAMAAAGCVEASVGFESGSEAVLRGMNKGFGPEDVRSACVAVAGAGVAPFGFLMFGAPSETKETVLRSLDFVESLPLAGLKTTVGVRIYPGTPLAQRAVREGVVSAHDDLLRPRFYINPELESWIHEELERRGLAAE